ELARLCAVWDEPALRHVVTANNQRLFRAAWSILKNRDDAEDAVQSAYLKAFAAIGTFNGKSSLSTWLTRITINEALGRLRADKRRRARFEDASVLVLDDYRENLMRGSTPPSPDSAIAGVQVRQMLETAIARLPAPFRTVFVLREIEHLSVADVAESLGIPAATVKTRHLRARLRLQQDLAPELRDALTGTFPFAGVNCERLTARVVAEFCGAATDQ
ncbi:MAG: RNA polymerase sigma factor, partial [Sphingomicrobium sp.]